MASPKIVLTASSTEASEFKHSIWQQMLSPTIPQKYSHKFINPASLVNDSWPNGRAKYVPNGLRMVETLLLRDYAEEDVVTCYVENLDKFVGPETKVVAVHAHNPLEHIMESVRVNAREGATEVMLAAEDMFLYEQLPNFVTNTPALEKLFRSVASVRGIETIQTSHITIAPVVKDPTVIERLTPTVVPYSHLHHDDSTDPNKCIADPIIGLETGSPRLFDTYMKGKAYPYKAHQWRDVVLKGMEILNRHNWYPFCTFIIGLPGERDEDTKQSLDLLFDLRDAKGMFVPTWFVPLENTRMQKRERAKLIEMTDLQWEFFFTCWKYNIEFYGKGRSRSKWSLGVPFYYKLLGKKLFGHGIKYPLWRFAGWPDRFMRKHLYLDFTGRKRNKAGMRPFEKEIIPGFETVRGLNMIDASQLHRAKTDLPVGAATASASGD